MNRWLLLSSLVLMAVVFVLWRDARAMERPPLPLRFAHADHDDVGCIDCHHEFVDATPRGPCIECHLQDAALRVRMQADFHDLCRGCHVDRRAQALAAGPSRRCHDCHQQDEAP